MVSGGETQLQVSDNSKFNNLAPDVLYSITRWKTTPAATNAASNIAMHFVKGTGPG